MGLTGLGLTLMLSSSCMFFRREAVSELSVLTEKALLLRRYKLHTKISAIKPNPTISVTDAIEIAALITRSEDDTKKLSEVTAAGSTNRTYISFADQIYCSATNS